MSSAFVYDPAVAIPFLGFRQPGDESCQAPFDDGPEYYPSFLHWYESEKFRGISERYRRYLMLLEDASIVSMEASGFSDSHKRADWETHRERVITCGLLFQFTQNVDLLNTLLDSETVICRYPLFEQGLANIKALLSGQRRGVHVAVHGDAACQDASIVMSRLDAMFSKTRPDTLLLTDEDGVPVLAEAWALKHHVAIERLPLCEHDEDPVTARHQRLVAGATHVILLAQNPHEPPFIQAIKALAESEGRQTKLLSLSQPTAKV